MKTLKIKTIIKSVNAIGNYQAILITTELEKYFIKNEPVILSFEGLKNVSSAFILHIIVNSYLDFPNSENLFTFVDVKEYIWKIKIQDAIDLAKDPERLALRNKLIEDLMNS